MASLLVLLSCPETKRSTRLHRNSNRRSGFVPVGVYDPTRMITIQKHAHFCYRLACEVYELRPAKRQETSRRLSAEAGLRLSRWERDSKDLGFRVFGVGCSQVSTISCVLSVLPPLLRYNMGYMGTFL